MGHPPVKVRFNAKARGSQPGTSGKRSRPKKSREVPVTDGIHADYELDAVQGFQIEASLSKKESREVERQKRKEEMKAEACAFYGLQADILVLNCFKFITSLACR